MTEQESSGGSAPVADNSAPAHTAGTAAAFFSDASTVSAFGTTRGSGLARGKRNAPRSAQADTEPKVEYKPTSIELITPQREYSNPFASETPANVPVETPAPIQPVAYKAPAPVAAVVEATVETKSEAVSFEAPQSAAITAEKSEIKILPPEETKRTAVSWDSSSAPVQDEQPRRDQRPVFRPEPQAVNNRVRPNRVAVIVPATTVRVTTAGPATIVPVTIAPGKIAPSSTVQEKVEPTAAVTVRVSRGMTSAAKGRLRPLLLKWPRNQAVSSLG